MNWVKRNVDAFREPAWFKDFLGREMAAGAEIPTGYGIAWKCWERDAYVIMPIPLNLITSWFRALWYGGIHWYTLDALAKAADKAYWQGRADCRDNHKAWTATITQERDTAFERGVAKGRRDVLEEILKEIGRRGTN